MPCDRQLKRGQTISSRKEEIRSTVAKLSQKLASGAVKAKVGPRGAITFVGLSETDRNGVTDICAYRQIMISGSATAKLAIARAEQLAGITVNKQTLAIGTHSHDGGMTWHNHKG